MIVFGIFSNVNTNNAFGFDEKSKHLYTMKNISIFKERKAFLKNNKKIGCD